MGELLLKRAVMREIFSRMGLAHVDDEKCEPLVLVLFVELCKWGNLPHERRSSDAAELKQQMFFFCEILQRNFSAIEIREREIRCLCPHFRYGAKLGRIDITLPERCVVIRIHRLPPLPVPDSYIISGQTCRLGPGCFASSSLTYRLTANGTLAEDRLRV